jgi:hypothetical protein
MAAPIVRRKFASSPKDPRYHMLSHLSSKFTLGPEEQTHEPRAALFLNRFTRTLAIMYATSGIDQIIGISSEDMLGRSFFECVEENCLNDAINCLESAKGNDSIAYLRFFFRDPRQDDEPPSSESEDDTMTDITSDDDSETDTDYGGPSVAAHTPAAIPNGHSSMDASGEETPENLRTSSNQGSYGSYGSLRSPSAENRPGPIELEAVVSCPSHGTGCRVARPRAACSPTQRSYLCCSVGCTASVPSRFAATTALSAGGTASYYGTGTLSAYAKRLYAKHSRCWCFCLGTCRYQWKLGRLHSWQASWRESAARRIPHLGTYAYN